MGNRKLAFATNRNNSPHSNRKRRVPRSPLRPRPTFVGASFLDMRGKPSPRVGAQKQQAIDFNSLLLLRYGQGALAGNQCARHNLHARNARGAFNLLLSFPSLPNCSAARKKESIGVQYSLGPLFGWPLLGPNLQSNRHKNRNETRERREGRRGKVKHKKGKIGRAENSGAFSCLSGWTPIEEKDLACCC